MTYSVLRAMVLALPALIVVSCVSSDRQATARTVSHDDDSSTATGTDSVWVPSAIENRSNTDSVGSVTQYDVVHFRSGRRLVVPRYLVRYVAQIPRDRKAPLLVFSGYECDACDVDRDVIIVAADSDSVPAIAHGFAFPGDKFDDDPDSEDSQPYYRSRLFVGLCLPDSDHSAVWYQSARDSLDTWRDQVFRYAVVGDSVQMGFVTPPPALDATLSRGGLL